MDFLIFGISQKKKNTYRMRFAFRKTVGIYFKNVENKKQHITILEIARDLNSNQTIPKMDYSTICNHIIP